MELPQPGTPPSHEIRYLLSSPSSGSLVFPLFSLSPSAALLRLSLTHVIVLSIVFSRCLSYTSHPSQFFLFVLQQSLSISLALYSVSCSLFLPPLFLPLSLYFSPPPFSSSFSTTVTDCSRNLSLFSRDTDFFFYKSFVYIFAGNRSAYCRDEKKKKRDV